MHLTHRTSFKQKLTLTGTNRSLFLILITVCFAACGDKERQQQLESREQAIIKREMEFAAKAADYQSLLRLRDSLVSKKSDTIFVQRWPEGISGSWNGKMLCRESNCDFKIPAGAYNYTQCSFIIKQNQSTPFAWFNHCRCDSRTKWL